MTHTVLVVDDEPSIRLSLEFLMRNAGFDVRCASDGEEALRAVRAHPPDLVVLDVSMPNMNGYEVCEAIRANPKWRGVRILMLTARGRDSERDKGLAIGADDYVTKPFATKDVLQRAQNLFDAGDEERT